MDLADKMIECVKTAKEEEWDSNKIIRRLTEIYDKERELAQTINLNVIVNITGDHNNVAVTVPPLRQLSHKDIYKRWIRDNPPEKRILSEYYSRFIACNGDKLSNKKI